MADDSPQPQALQAQVSSAPNVVVANKTAVTVQSTDLIIWAGTSRAAFKGNGEPVGTGVEYSVGLSMSPIAAKHLVSMLTICLDQYEAAYGRIPVDPVAEKKFAGLRNDKMFDIVEVAEPKKAPARAKKPARGK